MLSSSTHALRAAFFIALCLLVDRNPVSAQAITSPWSSADIGAPQIAGSSSSWNGAFRIDAAGEDIWSSSDQFHFVYQSISGDVEIVARVDSFSAPHGWAKAGVMIRGSLSADSAHAYALASWENGIAYQRRTSAGAGSVSAAGPLASPPHWVRLVRSGETITSYSSIDGTAWTMIGSDRIALGATAYVGIAVTSHDPNQRATATFSNLRVSSLANPSGTLQSADIGAPLIAGSTSVAGSTYGVRAGGVDIWDTSDQFRFVYRQVAGDIDVIARVASLDAVDTWTKAGVMIRESLTAGSRHASAFAAGYGGYAFQRRIDAGSWSEHTEGAGGGVPVWLRLVRSGSRFDAYHSPDGTSWTKMGSDVIPMADSVYVGIAVTSHNETVAASADVDNLRITSSVGGTTAPDPTPAPSPAPSPTPVPDTSLPPRAVVFDASADHATLVTRYVLEIYSSGATPGSSSPVATSDLGKPAVAADGGITVDRSTLFLALLPGNYIATVTAVGQTGSSRSLTASFTR
jgi:regulation of enolase protein 1 (concanavalin A-like superfamily)